MGNKEVITVKPFMQVKKLEQLAYLSEMKRSVVCPAFSSWSKPKPAAFIFCMPASRVLKLIEKGLYVYVPKEKPKYKTWTPKRN